MVKYINFTFVVVMIVKFISINTLVVNPFVALWITFVFMIPQIVSTVLWIASSIIVAALIHILIAIPLWRILILGGFESYIQGHYQLVKDSSITLHGWVFLCILAFADLVLIFFVYNVIRLFSSKKT